jgi:hypothetical protein
MIELAQAVFRVIGTQDPEGAEARTILDGVDYLEKVRLSLEELRATLAHLKARGLIEEAESKFRLTERARGLVPRTKSGRVSAGRKAWNRLWERLSDSTEG